MKYSNELQKHISNFTAQARGALTKHLNGEKRSDVPKSIPANLYKELKELTFPDDLSWTERLVWIINDIYSKPMCIGTGCANSASFLLATGKYSSFCSRDCERSNRTAHNKHKIEYHNPQTHEVLYLGSSDAVPQGFVRGESAQTKEKKSLAKLGKTRGPYKKNNRA
jgi:hypothetical protein